MAHRQEGPGKHPHKGSPESSQTKKAGGHGTETSESKSREQRGEESQHRSHEREPHGKR